MALLRERPLGAFQKCSGRIKPAEVIDQLTIERPAGRAFLDVTHGKPCFLGLRSTLSNLRTVKSSNVQSGERNKRAWRSCCVLFCDRGWMSSDVAANFVRGAVRCGTARFPFRPSRSVSRVGTLDDRGGENTYRNRIGPNFCHEFFHRTRCRYLVLLMSRTLYLWRGIPISGINKE